ncbi:hypothetical protein [Lewinella sp. W8]|uniref:hypothetical protein n=1 Tax=Lewinella sp. W8 TaxID=2528208 RepID=UPI00106839A3|nr:hypothetical protein [Lewinella sp. W8]MTB51890.1 hypothetical protein [Lewinella sp. W8]
MNKRRFDRLLRWSGWTLLVLLLLAPACTPKENNTQSEERSEHLVLLTDAARWPEGRLAALKDSLQDENFRVVVSGYPGERTDELLARLPWLLQPGIDLMLVDPDFLSPAGVDSLKTFLAERGQPQIKVTSLVR